MAVMNATFTARVPSGSNLQAVANTINKLALLKPDPLSTVRSPLAACFQDIATETVQQFAAAIDHAAPRAVQKIWLSGCTEARQSGDLAASAAAGHEQQSTWGRLLWLHPVNLFSVDGDDRDVEATSAALTPPFYQSIKVPGGIFMPGIEWSAVVAKRNTVGFEKPLAITELHWAYFALYMEIDRGLLALLDNARWGKRESLDELEEDANVVFESYIRITGARARLDSALASLGGDEFAIWETIAAVQKFDAIVEAVDRKVQVLRRVAERRVSQAAASRERQSSRILSGLTALTLVTVAVALIGSFLGSRTDALGHVGLRIAIIAAAVAASFGVYRWAYRERVHRHDWAAEDND
jgi:hypothetical protein